MIRQNRIIELTEYKPEYFPEDYLEDHVAKSIFDNFSRYVSVEQPGWKTNQQWQLTSNGWVGFIPVNEELTLSLNSKVPIQNLFRMLEYAYRLDPFVVEGFYESESLNEFYETLAKLLAYRVLDRKRKGLYKKYLDKQDVLPYIRGSIEFQKSFRKPWQVNIPSSYQEHTSDIADNQLLVWTLYVIIRSGICSEKSNPIIRKAYRELHRVIQIYPFSPLDCINRLYDRLNEDYKPMHILCRFFLENSGPTKNLGDHTMIPFIIDMASLFELFVAEWISLNLPDELELIRHDRVRFGESGEITFDIDLVINEKNTGETVFVLDTKYKAPESPSNPDINQIVTYSVAKRCKRAILIYPTEIPNSFVGTLHDINARTMTFSLADDLEKAGHIFLKEMLSTLSNRIQ